VDSHYTTRGGIAVHRTVEELPYGGPDAEALVDALDARRGLLLASTCEVPGRYARHDLGLVDPLLALTGRGRTLEVAAPSARGCVLLPALEAALRALPELAELEACEGRLRAVVRAPAGPFSEEERGRQPSLFSLLRAVIALFASGEDAHLGLYGAFGYDLAFQLEPIALRTLRAADQRDLVLYLPDEILVVDHRKEHSERRRYDFACGGASTAGVAREPAPSPYPFESEEPGPGAPCGAG
jgi:anthranilate synthase